MNPTDIFLWANQTDGYKNELEVELFLFNKNFTPYSTSFGESLNNSINPLFLFDLINFVNLGAGTGLSVRDITTVDKKENQLARINLGQVGRAETLLHLIENERKDIVEFNADEHEFKRIQGIVARYSHPKQKDVKFYVIKQLKPSTVVLGAQAWQFASNKFIAQSVHASMKMPADNQVLIVGDDIFAFNTSKFAALFKFDASQVALAKEKGAAIDKHFRLSMPTTINEFAFFAETKSSNVKKLLEVNVDDLMSQEQVIETADEMQIEIMTDDNGAIILMDGNDVGIFLDIINDNYVRGVTGHSYLAKKKQPLFLAEEAEPKHG